MRDVAGQGPTQAAPDLLLVSDAWLRRISPSLEAQSATPNETDLGLAAICGV